MNEILTTMLRLMHKQSALIFEATAEVAALRKVVSGLGPEVEKSITKQIVIERARISKSAAGMDVLTSALRTPVSEVRN